MQKNVVIGNRYWNKPETDNPQYSQLELYYDKKYKTTWCHMRPEPRPCFTPALINEIVDSHEVIKRNFDDEELRSKFVVLLSDDPNIFNLGGDLNFIEQCLIKNDRAALMKYAEGSIQAVYNYYSSMDLPLTTISLVQGDALGGGFEAALASNVLIAERSAKFGLPEVLFNMIAGMGAYNFLSRKIGIPETEKMILSGRIYTAEELYDMGIVDVIAEDGQGEAAVCDYIQKEKRIKNTVQALRKANRIVNPVTYQELYDIIEVWADSLFNLEPRDIKMMQRLVKRQDKKSGIKY